eukprot:TRINITY_DN5846_c0_g1_i1.p1 TRINITY_DN5846_c0_g1~~TRINITY_DN5846_c0_g1_i1.p1  ORF type:complete len:1137 (+),score=298.65 TRINITY_DN5846_c0_g1_i1:198-3413(+)
MDELRNTLGRSAAVNDVDRRFLSQKKTFITWIRIHLRSRKLPVEAVKDLSDGYLLGQLVEVLTGNDLPTLIEKPANTFERVQNVNICLQMLRKDKFPLIGIGAEDIAECNEKLIMGLVWTMILRYHIKVSKETLLQWCQTFVSQRVVELPNFRPKTWKNPLGFASLVNAVRPGTLDMDALKKGDNVRSELARALKSIEDDLDIPAVIDADDILDAQSDERSIMTYVGYFYQYATAASIEAAPAPTTCVCGFAVVDAEEVKDLRYKLQKKEEEIAQLKAQLESQRVEISGSADEIQKMRDEATQLVEDLADFREKYSQLENQLEIAMLRVPLMVEAAASAHAHPETEAPPTGEVTLVFTDVQGSTTQWETHPEIMAAALSRHNRRIRELIAEHHGYEVKTEGDAFMVSFTDPLKATNLCLAVQNELMKEEWSEELVMHPDSRVEKDRYGVPYFNGLRVRMGVHTGTPSCEPDPITGRMDYFGPMVNRAARVGGMGFGGQIILSGSTYAEVKERSSELLVPADLTELGQFRMKGLDSDELLVQIQAKSLSARTFASVSKENAASKDGLKELTALKEANELLIERLQASERSAEALQARTSVLLEKMRELQASASSETQQEMLGVMSDMGELMTSQKELKSTLKKTKVENMAHQERLSAMATQFEKLKKSAAGADAMRHQLRDEADRLKQSNNKLTKLMIDNGKLFEMVDRMKTILAKCECGKKINAPAPKPAPVQPKPAAVDRDAEYARLKKEHERERARALHLPIEENGNHQRPVGRAPASMSSPPNTPSPSTTPRDRTSNVSSPRHEESYQSPPTSYRSPTRVPSGVSHVNAGRYEAPSLLSKKEFTDFAPNLKELMMAVKDASTAMEQETSRSFTLMESGQRRAWNKERLSPLVLAVGRAKANCPSVYHDPFDYHLDMFRQAVDWTLQGNGVEAVRLCARNLLIIGKAVTTFSNVPSLSVPVFQEGAQPSVPPSFDAGRMAATPNLRDTIISSNSTGDRELGRRITQAVLQAVVNHAELAVAKEQLERIIHVTHREDLRQVISLIDACRNDPSAQYRNQLQAVVRQLLMS